MPQIGRLRAWSSYSVGSIPPGSSRAVPFQARPRDFSRELGAAMGFPYRHALPELISFLLLLLVWFALLRWLYWKPLTLDRPQQDAHVAPMSPG